jgi:hypothetical protein
VGLEDAPGRAAIIKRKKSSAPYKDPMAGKKQDSSSKGSARNIKERSYQKGKVFMFIHYEKKRGNGVMMSSARHYCDLLPEQSASTLLHNTEQTEHKVNKLHNTEQKFAQLNYINSLLLILKSLTY